MTEVQVKQLHTGTLVREGAGVKLQRYIGADRTNDFEPILLLDYFDSKTSMDYIAGFPSHPHRGFETVTYLLQGKIKHEDNQGHQGIIGPGDVQWMTAGRGVIHSEMPEQSEEGLKGLQLWLNLPAASKLIPPAYQEFTAAQLPKEHLENDITIKVIAGKTNKGTESPIKGIATEPLFFDIIIPSSQQLIQTIPLTHQAIVLVIEGELTVQQHKIPAQTMAILGQGDTLTLVAQDIKTRCLLIAAKKLHEPIARLGPFVMNTEAEIAQAIDDFRNNRFS